MSSWKCVRERDNLEIQMVYHGEVSSVSFPPNETNINEIYIITYTDNNGGTLTKSVTVTPCPEGPVIEYCSFTAYCNGIGSTISFYNGDEVLDAHTYESNDDYVFKPQTDIQTVTAKVKNGLWYFEETEKIINCNERVIFGASSHIPIKFKLTFESTTEHVFNEFKFNIYGLDMNDNSMVGNYLVYNGGYNGATSDEEIAERTGTLEYNVDATLNLNTLRYNLSYYYIVIAILKNNDGLELPDRVNKVRVNSSSINNDNIYTEPYISSWLFDVDSEANSYIYVKLPLNIFIYNEITKITIPVGFG